MSTEVGNAAILLYSYKRLTSDTTKLHPIQRGQIREMRKHLTRMRNAGYQVNIGDDGQIMVTGGWPLTFQQQQWIKDNTRIIAACLQQDKPP